MLCLLAKVPRDNADPKHTFWKRLDRDGTVLAQLDRHLDCALTDLHWKIQDPSEALLQLAGHLQTYAGTKPHITLHGFPTPPVVAALQRGAQQIEQPNDAREGNALQPHALAQPNEDDDNADVGALQPAAPADAEAEPEDNADENDGAYE